MIRGEEMHKSLGNMITLRQAFEQYDPLAIRFFILGGHYRSQLDFTDEAMQAADKGLQRILGTVRAVRERMRSAGSADGADGTDEADVGVLAMLDGIRARFEESKDDDFNTAQAVAVLFDLGREVNTLLHSGQALSGATLAAIDDLYRRLGGDVLGIVPDQLPEDAGVGLTDELVRILIEMRAEARQKKDWTTADAIRDRLAAIGIALEDGPDGTRWRLAR